MQYVLCRIRQYEKEVAYRLYMSDLFFYQARGKTQEQRYADIAFYKKKIDPRSADEIALDIIKRAGLHVG